MKYLSEFCEISYKYIFKGKRWKTKMLNDWFDVKTIQNTYENVCTALRFSQHSVKCAVSYSFKCEFSVNSLQAIGCVRIDYESCSRLLWSTEQMDEDDAVAATAVFIVVVFIWLPSGKRFHRSLWHEHNQTNWNWFFLLILSRARISPKRYNECIYLYGKRDGIFILLLPKCGARRFFAVLVVVFIKLWMFFCMYMVYVCACACVRPYLSINTHVRTHHFLVDRNRFVWRTC